jgi:hypothetical protein
LEKFGKVESFLSVDISFTVKKRAKWMLKAQSIEKSTPGLVTY